MSWAPGLHGNARAPGLRGNAGMDHARLNRELSSRAASAVKPAGRCADPQRRSAAPGTAARPRACAILAAMSNPLARARYLLAAHTPRQLPPDGGYEVAFAGRSNAGKSSALNALCQQNALARVSKTPGRTQQLVFFDVTARSEAR